MKNPLSYQLTEYDCGPTSVINAISYLYDRQEIPPEFLKHVMQCCLDSCNEKGEPCRHGTSCDAMNYLASWFNLYAKIVKFPIWCEHLTKNEVHLSKESPIYKCLSEGGAAVARCNLDGPHYITLTGIDDEYVYAFDCYYEEEPMQQEGVTFIYDKPCTMNRKIKWNVLENEGTEDYAFGEECNRDVTLFYKIIKENEMDSAVNQVL